MASPSTNEVIRIKEGGKIVDKIAVQTNAYACVLGGKDRKTLFVCTSGGSDMQSCIEKKEGRIESFQVDIPGIGIP
jgi:sugar lactone lactonase YvrE